MIFRKAGNRTLPCYRLFTESCRYNRNNFFINNLYVICRDEFGRNYISFLWSPITLFDGALPQTGDTPWHMLNWMECFCTAYYWQTWRNRKTKKKGITAIASLVELRIFRLLARIIDKKKAGKLIFLFKKLNRRKQRWTCVKT